MTTTMTATTLWITTNTSIPHVNSPGNWTPPSRLSNWQGRDPGKQKYPTQRRRRLRFRGSLRVPVLHPSTHQGTGRPYQDSQTGGAEIQVSRNIPHNGDDGYDLVDLYEYNYFTHQLPTQLNAPIKTLKLARSRSRYVDLSHQDTETGGNEVKVSRPPLSKYLHLNMARSSSR